MQRREQLKHAGTAARRQRGVTLIETLIALLIFAVGMLGISGLLSATVKYQSGNAARANVTANITDLAERIRSNVAASNGFSSVLPGSTATATVGTGYQYNATYAAQSGAISDYAKDCMAVSCTQAERADFDVIQWRKSLQSTLPGGAGLISGTVTNGFDVTIMWFDKDTVKNSDSDFVDDVTTNQVCTSGDDPTAAISRFCCPAAASAPAGVRCYNAKVIP